VTSETPTTDNRLIGDGGRRASFTERIARASATHPWRTICIWLALVIAGVGAIGALLGGALTSDTHFRGTSPDSVIGQRLLQDRLTGSKSLTDFVIVRSETYTVADPAYKQFVTGLAAKITGLGPSVVTGASTFSTTGDSSLVSKDGHATLIPVIMAGGVDQGMKNADKLHALVVANAGHGFRLAQTGDASINRMATTLAESDLGRAEIFGVPAALVVLLVVFGAVLAAFMPLGLGIISIVLAVALTSLIGHVYTMSTFVMNVLSMMGLAVGIDYTLFIISRYREERARGLAKTDAIAATGATANRAIFFSGMTVVLAMVGMTIVPVDITISMGIGVMLVVVTTLATTLVLLPALLGLLGDRVNALRLPFIGYRAHKRPHAHRGVWERLAHSIMRRPVVWLTAAVAVLLAAAAPVFWMKTGNNQMNAANYPSGQYAVQGWKMLGRDFTLGKASPVQFVVDGPARSSQVKAAVVRLQTLLSNDGRFGPANITVNKAGDLTLLEAPMAGNPASDASQAVIKHLRTDTVPKAFGGGVPARVYVSGTTAGVVDYLGFFHHWLPITIAVVLALSFVLLLLAFRSVVIPAKAILMNLLSVGASYGLLVLVFQKGVGASLFGFQKVESIEAWVPLLLFSMLFGLSMDYQVFLISRIKERYDHTSDTREAVGYGIGRTAGIITGAAAIMVCVFAGVAGGQLVMFQQMGFGLAVAILVDATIVRTIIVPSAMELLGDWNWYLPRWLEWLPNVAVEGHGHEKPAEPNAERPPHEWVPGVTATETGTSS
jgi:RND superfamily putative drug exporter